MSHDLIGSLSGLETEIYQHSDLHKARQHFQSIFAAMKGTQRPSHVQIFSASIREISQFVSQDRQKFVRRALIYGVATQDGLMMIIGNSLEHFLEIRKHSFYQYFDRAG
jgi:uncharacterized protein with von Willebrand factor type A (vWA) domain